MTTARQHLKDSHWRGRIGAKILRWSISDTSRSGRATETSITERTKVELAHGKEAIVEVQAELLEVATRAGVRVIVREDEVEELATVVAVGEVEEAMIEVAEEGVEEGVAASRTRPLMELQTRKLLLTSLLLRVGSLERMKAGADVVGMWRACSWGGC
jgi:hypothetical protein